MIKLKNTLKLKTLDVNSDIKDIEAEMAKFNPKEMKMEDYPAWKKLNNEKTRREEQLNGINTMLNEAKNFERNNDASFLIFAYPFKSFISFFCVNVELLPVLENLLYLILLFATIQ